jgi:ParB family chromosome partitioning protein
LGALVRRSAPVTVSRKDESRAGTIASPSGNAQDEAPNLARTVVSSTPDARTDASTPRAVTTSVSVSVSESEGEGGPAVRWLQVDELAVWKSNPRRVIDPQKLDTLAENIERNGQQTPIEVVPNPDASGKYLILAGQRRWLAIRSRNLQEGRVLARIRTDLTTPEAMFAAAVDTQVNTEPLLDIDFAISLAKDTAEFTLRALGRTLGKDPSELSKLRQIGELPESVLSVLKRGASKFSYPFAYEVVHVQQKVGDAQAIAFAEEILLRNHTFRRTVTRRDEIVGARTRQGRSSWDTERFAGDGKPVGVLKTRPESGEVNLTLSRLSAEQVERIRDALKEIIRPSSPAQTTAPSNAPGSSSSSDS